MRVLIFANGQLDEDDADLKAWVAASDLCVAADGGTRAALRAGATPNHVVGDLDSLPEPLRRQLQDAGTQFHTSPAEKDETDLELALMWAAGQPGCDEVVVLGAFGGRPDQELANLLLLALPALEDWTVLMVKGAWTTRLLRGPGDLTLAGAPGDQFSLIPLGGPAVGVRTEGLAFPLKDETLSFGRARGVSNRFEGERVTVRLQEGLLWCFHEDRRAAGRRA